MPLAEFCFRVKFWATTPRFYDNERGKEQGLFALWSIGLIRSAANVRDRDALARSHSGLPAGRARAVLGTCQHARM